MSATASVSKLTVGVEIHARVKATTKLFSGASALARDPITGRPPAPNALVGWLDCALPGAMPRLNQFCVDQAIASGIALQGEIQSRSVFERKHYFYCDSPLGYQITQQSYPIVLGGLVELSNKKKVRLTRIQLEQDTAKSFHLPSSTLVDFNRAGVALMEIVSEPDIDSAQDAAEYVRIVQRLLRHINSCDGNMEDGSLRADVNVSVMRKDGSKSHRVEIKNLNSLRSIERAVMFEQKRLECLAGPMGLNETRTFDVKTGQTIPMREKEGKVDYRFMPEPDLPPLLIDQARIERVRQKMHELPESTRDRLVQHYGLRQAETDILMQSSFLLGFFEEICEQTPNASPPLVATVLCNTLLGAVRKEAVEDEELALTKINREDLSELLQKLESKQISNQQAKEFVYDSLVKGERLDFASKLGKKGPTDEEMQVVCLKVLEEFPDEVAKYKAGKKTLLNFFFGKAFAQLKRSSPDVDRLKRAMQTLLDKK